MDSVDNQILWIQIDSLVNKVGEISSEQNIVEDRLKNPRISGEERLFLNLQLEELIADKKVLSKRIKNIQEVFQQLLALWPRGMLKRLRWFV